MITRRILPNMNKRAARAAAGGLCIIALAFMMSGCASTEMKGTPFYTGEYGVRKGPAEDRINIWPLLYYRNPALSVLWPIGEFTEDHFAIRPLMSIYGLDKEKKVYNFLWPLCQLNRQSSENRLFPVFWGKDMFAVFPLYWHHKHPFGGDGYDGLVPVWSYHRDKYGFSLYVPWPVFHVKRTDSENGWHLWPLVGDYTHDDGYYRFLFWPLGHQWADQDGKESGHTLVPLYFKSKDSGGSFFLSLPWSSGNDNNGYSWQLMPPVFYHSSDKDRSMFLSALYSQGTSVSGKDAWNLFIPLYYRSKDEDGSMFVSVPWMSQGDGKGNGWQLVPPVFFRQKDGSGSKILTPLYSSGESDGGKNSWSMALPFYYESESEKQKLIATVLGGYSSDAEGKRWLIYPLLSGGRRGEGSGSIWLAAPLFHAEWDREYVSSHVLPLYYWNGESRTFVSPFYARWRTEGGRTTGLIPPALSWFTGGDRRSDLWVAGPLAHFSRGEDAGPSHVFPFYYHDRREGTVVSLPLAKWKYGNRSNTIFPLLLSGYSTDGEDLDMNVLLGLFHNRWDPDAHKRNGYLMPFYYYEDKTFFTPLFGWKNDDREGFMYPFTPVFGVRTGGYSGSWLFPFFSHNRERSTGKVDGTFLWGDYWRHGSKGGSGILPIYNYRNNGSLDNVSGTNRVGSYGKSFESLPAFWWRNNIEVRKDRSGKEIIINRRKNGLFPLWSYSDTENQLERRDDVSASVLLLFCDYKREKRPVKNDTQATTTYTRSRVLWRLWHYERSDDDVSVDVFPAITYDRKGDKYRKVSFLWRFFRYERDEKGKRADIFFVPVMRTGTMRRGAT